MRESDHHSILRTLASGVMPLLPTPIWLAMMRLRHKNNPIYTANPPWSAYSPIHPEFGKIHRVTERAREKGHGFYHRVRPYTRHLYYRYQLLFGGLSSQLSAGYEAQFGLDWRDPLGDLRIWEFCLSVPEEQYLRNGINRWLIRRAMKDKLHPKVVWNKKRGLQASDYYDRLYAARPSILNELSLLEKSDLARSILDLKRLHRLTEEMPKSGLDPEHMLNNYRLVLENGIMTGKFLNWFEKKDCKEERTK